jgi:hypothetical protein
MNNNDMSNLRTHVRSSLAFIVGCVLCSAAYAQSISVRLLDGKTGKPKSKFRVYIVLGNPKLQHTLDLSSDQHGYVRFNSGTEKTFQVRAVGVVTCGEQPLGVPLRDYSVDEVFRNGLVTVNDCGHLVPEAIRRQLTFLVRNATMTDLFRN